MFYFVSVVTFAVAILFERKTLANLKCSTSNNSKIYVPETKKLDKLSHNYYNISGSSLTIFINLVVPCDGARVVQWRFGSLTYNIQGLHLAFFRRTNNGRDVKLVDETFIDYFKTYGPVSNDSPARWLLYRCQKSPRNILKQGDMVGFFYDSVSIPSQLLTIMTKTIGLVDPDDPAAATVYVIPGIDSVKLAQLNGSFF